MKKAGNKAVVIDTGLAGISCVCSMSNQTLCDDSVLTDLSRKRTGGEVCDFRRGTPYTVLPAWIYVGNYGDYSDADIMRTRAGLP